MKSRFCLLLLAALFFVSCGDGSSGNDLDYIAIGASDANGVGAEPLSKGYVYRIEDGVSANVDSVALMNLAIPGADADQILDEVKIAKKVLGLSDFTTISVGANDIVSGRSVESFSSDIEDILTIAKNDFRGLIFIATIPKINLLPRFVAEPDLDVTLERVRLFNAEIRRLALTYDASLVELEDIEYSEGLVSSDGFHPSNEGHQLIAERFLSVMIPILKGLRSPDTTPEL